VRLQRADRDEDEGQECNSLIRIRPWFEERSRRYSDFVVNPDAAE
jgi:hypothetical protein